MLSLKCNLNARVLIVMISPPINLFLRMITYFGFQLKEKRCINGKLKLNRLSIQALLINKDSIILLLFSVLSLNKVKSQRSSVNQTKIFQPNEVNEIVKIYCNFINSHYFPSVNILYNCSCIRLKIQSKGNPERIIFVMFSTIEINKS